MDFLPRAGGGASVSVSVRLTTETQTQALRAYILYVLTTPHHHVEIFRTITSHVT